MNKTVIYYEDSKGIKPAKDFINAFDSKTKGKILARAEFLGEKWQELGRPYVDNLEKGLYELRIEFSSNTVRVIYAYMFKDYIVLLHGLRKKTRKIPESDKAIARKRMKDFQLRYSKGEIKL